MAVSSLKERLKELRKALGLNQKLFSQSILVSHSFYTQMENGTRNINSRIIELISAKFNVNKEWLKTGKGDMFSGEKPDTDLNQLIAVYQELDPLFKEYISLQIKQLLAVQKKGKTGAGLDHI
ncbi:hypothetical protein AGMMS49546_00340 [Spirochaetia bacterium]|nr:hypothetical protein AGMMS49546_00340 [Spirochaetia bacterium]